MWEETGNKRDKPLLQQSLMTYLVFKLVAGVLVLVLNGHTLLHVNESSSLAIRSTIEEVIALQIFAFIYKIFLFFNHL